MSTKRFLKIKGFCLSILLFLLILPTFSTIAAAEDATPSMPLPDIELFLEKGIYQWAEHNALLEKLTKTEAWEDLKLSGQFIGLLTLGNQLENQLGVQFTASLVQELMKTPAEISLWDVFDKDKETTFVVTLDLQPQFLNLVKLAELYSKSLKKSTVFKKNNLDLLETQWMKDRFYHLLRQNQLVVSNNPDALLYVVGDAAKPGSGPIRSFRDSAFFKTYHQPQQGNFKTRINLAAWLKNYKGLLDKDDLQLALNMDVGDTIHYYNFYLTAAPVFKANGTFNLENCTPLIPKEPLLAGAGFYPARYYWRLIKQLPSFEEFQDEFQVDFDLELLPMFKENFFFYLENLETKDSDNLINGVLGFSLKKTTLVQRQKLGDFVRWVMTPRGGAMKPSNVSPGIDIYRSEDASMPAFCVLDQWLLVGSGVERLKECLTVFSKRAPSLADAKEYQALKPSFAKNGYLQLYFTPAHFFQSLGEHFLFLAKTASDFNAADVKHKILPVTDILSTMSTLGVFLELKGESLEGRIRFVEQK